MNEDDKFTATLIGHVVTGMTLIIVTVSTGIPLVIPGTTLVFANLGRMFIELQKDERNGKKLTPEDIAELKKLVGSAQTKLNQVMGKKAAQNNDLYNLCNNMHDDLNVLRQKLDSKKVTHLRLNEHARVMSQIKTLTADLAKMSSK